MEQEVSLIHPDAIVRDDLDNYLRVIAFIGEAMPLTVAVSPI
jgi:hypothetical protein